MASYFTLRHNFDTQLELKKIVLILNMIKTNTVIIVNLTIDYIQFYEKQAHLIAQG